jgi:hypothetical protein
MGGTYGMHGRKYRDFSGEPHGKMPHKNTQGLPYRNMMGKAGVYSSKDRSQWRGRQGLTPGFYHTRGIL